MKSTFVVFPKKGEVEIREEILSGPESDEILCRAEKSLISIGTETYCLRGDFDPGTNWESWVKYPFRPGYSMAARAIEIGDSVTEVDLGDLVAVNTPHQEIFKVRAENAYRVPSNISAEEAAWLALGNTAQVGVRRADVDLGEDVGVIGLGMLGQLVVQFLANTGVRKIIAIDPVKDGVELASSHGATHGLVLDAEGALQDVGRLTNGRMLDAVFDVTGNPRVLAPAVRLLRKLGRLVLLGDTPNPSKQHLGPGVVSNSISILGIHASMRPRYRSEFNPWTYEEMADLFFDFIARKKMDVEALVTRHVSPTEASKVYKELTANRSRDIGVMFDWTDFSSGGIG